VAFIAFAMPSHSRLGRPASAELVPAVLEQAVVEPEKPLSLGQQWEACRVIRSRLRENNWTLLKWVKPELVNKPSMPAIALNCRALTILAQWWCPQQRKPKSPSVLDLKKEAMCFKLSLLKGSLQK